MHLGSQVQQQPNHDHERATTYLFHCRYVDDEDGLTY
jgi:hypothetical protein